MMVVSMLVIVPVTLVRVYVMLVVGTDRGAKNVIQMIVEVCRENGRVKYKVYLKNKEYICKTVHPVFLASNTAL